jgi:hypothetical protein
MKKTTFLLPFFFALATAGTLSRAQTLMPRDPVISGAVAGITVENLRHTVSDLVAFHNRNNLSGAGTSAERGTPTGINAAADYLYTRLSGFIPASDGRLSVEKVFYRVGGDAQSRFPREVELCNVVATVRGAGSDASGPAARRTIAVLAHYDNRGTDGLDAGSYVPGANDNGSGVACLMELARFLSTMEIKATVKLMFLSGEEHGLHGAEYMAGVAQREGWDLVAVLNNDMIGNSNASETDTHNNTVLRVFSENIPAAETDRQRAARVYNSSENDSPSRQLARYIKETGERYVDNMTVKLIYRNDRFGRGGDHTPFNRVGFPAVRLCEVNENYYRTHRNVEVRDGIRYGDEIEGIDFEYLRKNMAVNLATVASLALAPAEPEKVSVDVSRLENTTRITWEAPAHGEAPASYWVLMRETDAPHWQKKILVRGGANGNGGRSGAPAFEVRLPYSKDNYFFAVQGVNAAGHESLAVFATGVRGE